MDLPRMDWPCPLTSRHTDPLCCTPHHIYSVPPVIPAALSGTHPGRILLHTADLRDPYASGTGDDLSQFDFEMRPKMSARAALFGASMSMSMSMQSPSMTPIALALSSTGLTPGYDALSLTHLTLPTGHGHGRGHGPVGPGAAPHSGAATDAATSALRANGGESPAGGARFARATLFAESRGGGDADPHLSVSLRSASGDEQAGLGLGGAGGLGGHRVAYAGAGGVPISAQMAARGLPPLGGPALMTHSGPLPPGSHIHGHADGVAAAAAAAADPSFHTGPAAGRRVSFSTTARLSFSTTGRVAFLDPSSSSSSSSSDAGTGMAVDDDDDAAAAAAAALPATEDEEGSLADEHPMKVRPRAP